MERRRTSARRLRCGFIEIIALWAGLLALALLAAWLYSGLLLQYD